MDLCSGGSVESFVRREAHEQRQNKGIILRFVICDILLPLL
jgi:hypothetical protein